MGSTYFSHRGDISIDKSPYGHFAAQFYRIDIGIRF